MVSVFGYGPRNMAMLSSLRSIAMSEPEVCDPEFGRQQSAWVKSCEKKVLGPRD